MEEKTVFSSDRGKDDGATQAVSQRATGSVTIDPQELQAAQERDADPIAAGR
jgi:hypothetical protein